jgi:hypothetical protein
MVGCVLSRYIIICAAFLVDSHISEKKEAYKEKYCSIFVIFISGQSTAPFHIYPEVWILLEIPRALLKSHYSVTHRKYFR